ncbi:MAG: type II toxin-antitoxin system RelB/DinJ family antitoxin [Candidatus Nomurabacteria bacterium]
MDTTIQIRTNSKIKREAAKIFKKQGLSMSSAFNAFLEEVVYKGSLPVEVYPVEKIPAPVIRNWRKEIEKEMKTGKGYKSAEEFWEDMKTRK